MKNNLKVRCNKCLKWMVVHRYIQTNPFIVAMICRVCGIQIELYYE